MGRGAGFEGWKEGEKGGLKEDSKEGGRLGPGEPGREHPVWGGIGRKLRKGAGSGCHGAGHMG